MKKEYYNQFKIVGIFLLCLGFILPSAAQPVQFHALVMTGYSSTGFHISAAPMLSKANHRIWGGIEIQISDSYLPSSPVLGFQGGYQYELLHQRRWVTLVGIDYQQIFYQPYQPSGSPVVTYNNIIESMARLGLEYLPGKSGKFAIGIFLGYGLLRESFTDVTQDLRRHTNSQTSGVRMGFRYKF